MKSYDNLEQHLIGYALLKPEILNVVNPSDFSMEISQHLWRAMIYCRNEFDTIDLEVVSEYLLNEAGVDMTDHLREYMLAAPATEQLANHYAKIVVEASRKRRLDDEVKHLATADLPVDDTISSLHKILKTVEARTTKPTLTMKQLLREVVDKIEERMQGDLMPGLATGIPTLDKLTGGLQKGDLYILAARPSMGKTAMAINFALEMDRVGFVSAEQPQDQIIQRMISIKSRVSAFHLRNPRQMTDEDWPKLAPAMKALEDKGLQITDEAAPTIEAVRNWARRAVDKGAEIIILDYLQRIKAADRKLSSFDRISYIAMTLKEMAREMDVPVLALAQINRAGATAARMEHLKGSGDIEQEADMVMILERYLEDDPTTGNLKIEKNRHGAIGDVPLIFEPEIMKFGEAMMGQRNEEYF